MVKRILLCVVSLVWAASSEIVQQEVAYSSEDTSLTGIVVYDDSSDQKRPGVLIVHEWWGLNQFVIEKAQSLAQMGYVAFAADMYGDSASTADPQVAMKWSSHVRGTPLLRKRAGAALAQLKQHPLVRENHVAAIGFCFGGTTVLELAYDGAQLQGVVSFHGGLSVPKKSEHKQIQAAVLILHGAQDPTVKQKQINAFKQSMTEAEVDWQMIIYGGAKHGFTNPRADEYNLESLGYDPEADRRSRRHMELFLDDLFDRKASGPK